MKFLEEWNTKITLVEPDSLSISGYPLENLVASRGLLETAHVLVNGELPSPAVAEEMKRTMRMAAGLPAPPVKHLGGDDVSKTIAKCLLMDESLPSDGEPHMQTAFCIGRMMRYVAHVNNNSLEGEDVVSMLESALGGKKGSGRLLEAITVACVDHGVTPPSAQATLIAASTRASYEVAVASGISAITDVHGGAGFKAAFFFHEAVSSNEEGSDIEKSVEISVSRNIAEKKRIPGLGHRVHKNDPRRDVLWNLAEETGVAGKHTVASKAITSIFNRLSGKNLPINVDGVIGALVADMGLDFVHAKTLFIIGRTAGLSAHYFEELEMPKMRKLDFSKCTYSGSPRRA